MDRTGSRINGRRPVSESALRVRVPREGVIVEATLGEFTEHPLHRDLGYRDRLEATSPEWEEIFCPTEEPQQVDLREKLVGDLAWVYGSAKLTARRSRGKRWNRLLVSNKSRWC